MEQLKFNTLLYLSESIWVFEDAHRDIKQLRLHCFPLIHETVIIVMSALYWTLVASFVFLLIVFATPTRERELDDRETLGEICSLNDDLPVLEPAVTF